MITIDNKYLFYSGTIVLTILIATLIPFYGEVVIGGLGLILFIIISLLLKINFTKISIWGILFFLPFHTWNYDLGFFTLKPIHVFLVFGLIILFFNGEFFKRKYFIFFLLIPPFLSLVNSIAIRNTIVLTIALVLVFLLYITVFVFTQKFDKMFIINTILFSGVFTSVYGLYQYIGFNMGIDTGIHYNVWDFAPKINSFSVPNQFANFLILPILLSIYAIQQTENKYKKIIYLFTLLLCTSGLILTFSSGAIIALVIGLLIFGVITSRKTRFVTFTSLFVGFIILCVAISAGNLSGQFLNSFLDVRTGERSLLWSTAMDLALSSPIFGIGLDNFPVYAPKFLYYLSFEQHKEIHNTLLTIFTEMGIVGIIFYISAFITVLSKGFRTFFALEEKKDKLLLSCLLVTVLAMSIQYFTDNGLYVMHYWASYALLSGFTFKLNKKLNKTPSI